jgi:GLPGLI family protein
MKKIALLVSFTLLCININAQTKSAFQGVITFSLSFDNSGLPPEALAMFKNSEAVTYIKGDKTRMDMNMSIQSSSFIIDNANKTIVSLMDIMGQKFLIRMNQEEVKKEQEKSPETTIKYTNETKEIAGYKCKKAEITVNGSVANVYYTDEIPTTDTKVIYKGLKGFPMEYSVKQGGVEIKFVVTRVSKEDIADDKFEIPKEGYTETTIDGLQKALMSSMH